MRPDTPSGSPRTPVRLCRTAEQQLGPHLQVHVTNTSREHGPRVDRSLIQMIPEVVSGVEVGGGHPNLIAVVRPLLARTVGVQLDAVAFRISEVERLTDQVIA